MKAIKKPDLNAPRFREKSIGIVTNATLDKFKQKFPKYKNLSLEEFKGIVNTFNGNICDGIIGNRNGVELPEGLGFIFIGTCPPAKNADNIDYKKSFEFGVKATHRNWDSDNKLCKIFYTNHNTKYPLSNKQLWSFKPVRQFKRKTSAAYKEDWMRYIEVTPDEKISSRFTKHKRKQHMEKLNSQIPEDYNEFNVT